MIIGIGRETKKEESRVSVTPNGVTELVSAGHTLLVEPGAGNLSGFSDGDYQQAGAAIADKQEMYRRAGLIVKVKTPLDDEVPLLRADQTLFTYLHLDENIPPTFSQALAATGVNAIAYEWVAVNGQYVLLNPMSEITGAVFARRAIELLMDRKGVLGGSYYPGLPSARVLLIGAGTIGLSALNVFLRNRLEVVLFDKHPDTFFERAARAIPREVLENGRDLLQLEISSEENWRDTKRRLAEHLTTTDILFAAAVRRPTFPKSICEYLVSREMLLAMPDNGVVIDSTACDKDLIETAVSSPKLRFVYQDAGQWHYNCDHVPALVPVTATEQLTQATLPYIKELAALGFEAATEKNLALAGAVVCARGCLTHEYTCAKKGLDYTPLQKLLTDPVA